MCAGTNSNKPPCESEPRLDRWTCSGITCLASAVALLPRPKPNAESLLQRPEKLNSGGFKSRLNIDQRLRAAWWNAVVLFQPLDSLSCDFRFLS